MRILAPINIGELFDKITILEIKQQFTEDPDKLRNIVYELSQLHELSSSLQVPEELIEQLKSVNRKIWDVEDRIRFLESVEDFGADFVALARSVYKNNDERSAIKRLINDLTSSEIVEEKIFTTSYKR